jgi:hypothetical protein
MGKNFDVLMRQQRIAFTADIAPGVTIHGREDAIEDLVTNLVSNAVKYMTPSGLAQDHAWSAWHDMTVSGHRGRNSRTGHSIIFSSGSTGHGIIQEKERDWGWRYARLSPRSTGATIQVQSEERPTEHDVLDYVLSTFETRKRPAGVAKRRWRGNHQQNSINAPRRSDFRYTYQASLNARLSFTCNKGALNLL